MTVRQKHTQIFFFNSVISDNCLHRSCLQLNKLSMQMVKLNSEWDMKVCVSMLV